MEEDERLRRAVFGNDERAVREAILTGADVNAQVELASPDGVTGEPWHGSVLHGAVMIADKACVAALLDHGADIEAVDSKQGRTPLMHAIAGFMPGKVSTAEELIARGADVNAVDWEGNTVLDLLAVEGRAHLRTPGIVSDLETLRGIVSVAERAEQAGGQPCKKASRALLEEARRVVRSAGGGLQP